LSGGSGESRNGWRRIRGGKLEIGGWIWILEKNPREKLENLKGGLI